jgi:hypothetical protein
MTTTLTHVPTAAALSINRVLGYEATTEVPTVVHQIVGVASPDFSVAPARPRTGTFEFLCLNETDAITLRGFLCQLGSFTLADTDTNMADTTFLVTGNVTFALDVDTRQRVVVSADYTETVAP